LEELLLEILTYCYSTPSKCMLVQEALNELTWYACDVSRSNLATDIPFHVDGIVVTVKRDCTGA